MEERGIVNIPHFAPFFKFEIMKTLGYDVEFIEKTCPEAEEVFNHRFTHLPLYGLSEEQLSYMADSILDVLSEMQSGK